MECVIPISNSMLICGLPSHLFQPEPGLRQGDTFIFLSFYSLYGGSFWFASEIKSLLKCGWLGIEYGLLSMNF